MRKRRTALLLAAFFMLIGNTVSFAGGGTGEEQDTGNLVKAITLEMKGKDPTVTEAEKDEAPYLGYESPLNMKIQLDYDPQVHGALVQGDKLEISLNTLEPTTNDYVTFYGSSSIDGPFNGTVTDTGESKKIGDLHFTSKGIQLTFVDFNEPFTGTITLPYAKRSDNRIEEYFEKHPGETTLNFTAQVFVNDIGKDQFVKLSLPKMLASEPTDEFLEKRGRYWPEDNNFLYNALGATKLRKTNELFLYDTPDINLRFNSDLKFFVTKSANDGAGKQMIYSITTSPQPYYNMTKSADWTIATDPEKAESTDSQMWLYDLYYLVDKVDNLATEVPMADYEEKTMELSHPLLADDPNKNSLEPVSQPNNILFYVPVGQELTENQKAQIEAAGGLNKKVGKGFFIHAYNVQNPDVEKGTYFKIVYSMDIANESPVKNDKGDPVYFNSMSYYIQEIPNCPPGETCAPIEAERSKVAESKRNGKLNVKHPIVYSSYDAEISPYKPVNIVKKDQEGTLVADAEFTIYMVNPDQTRGEIAKNNMNQEMTGLISNAEGKLVDKETGQPVRIFLKAGHYELVETVVPAGYKTEESSTFFEVTKGALSLPVINTKIETDPEEPADPTEPEQPTDPEQPVEPEKPNEPQQPAGPTEPEQPKTPEKPQPQPEQPNSSSRTVEVSVSEKPAAPTTGDTFHLVLFVGSMFVAIGLLGLLRKRERSL